MQTIEAELEADANAVIAQSIRMTAEVVGHLATSPDFAARPSATREDRLRAAIVAGQITIKYEQLLNEATDREEDAAYAVVKAGDLAAGETYEHDGWRVVGLKRGIRIEPLTILNALDDDQVSERSTEQIDKLGLARLLEMMGLPVPGQPQVADSGQVLTENGAAPVDPTSPG